MSTPVVTRETLGSSVVQLASTEGRFRFSRPRSGVLLIEVEGHDSGQFGTSALDEIASVLARDRPLELFIDTRAAISVSPRVRDEWTRFFSSNRTNLTAVHVLTGSKIVQLVIAVAQLLSNTGNLIRLYSTAQTFQTLLNGPVVGSPGRVLSSGRGPEPSV